MSDIKNECPVCFSNEKLYYINCGQCQKTCFCNDCFEEMKNRSNNVKCSLCRHDFRTRRPIPGAPPQQNITINNSSNITVNTPTNEQIIFVEIFIGL